MVSQKPWINQCEEDHRAVAEVLVSSQCEEAGMTQEAEGASKFLLRNPHYSPGAAH